MLEHFPDGGARQAKRQRVIKSLFRQTNCIQTLPQLVEQKNKKRQVIGVESVKYKPSALAVEEAAKISDMMCEEDPEISKTRELLSEAQLLTRDIEKLLDLCTSTGPSYQRRNRTIQQECQASIEEDGETLVIEGFRFESAASREDLRRLSSQAGAGGRQGDT